MILCFLAQLMTLNYKKFNRVLPLCVCVRISCLTFRDVIANIFPVDIVSSRKELLTLYI